MPKIKEFYHKMIAKPPAPYYVSTIYYIPLQYATSLIAQGHSRSDAINLTLQRFAYYGKHNHKQLKAFDQNQFEHHLKIFLDTPDAILIRKASKY